MAPARVVLVFAIASDVGKEGEHDVAVANECCWLFAGQVVWALLAKHALVYHFYVRMFEDLWPASFMNEMCWPRILCEEESLQCDLKPCHSSTEVNMGHVLLVVI